MLCSIGTGLYFFASSGVSLQKRFGMFLSLIHIWHLVIKISAGDDVVYFQTLMDGRSIWDNMAKYT